MRQEQVAGDKRQETTKIQETRERDKRQETGDKSTVSRVLVNNWNLIWIFLQTLVQKWHELAPL